MTRRRVHTLESCRAAAATVATISELKRKHPLIYHAAHREGWIDQLGLARQALPKQEPWTRERMAEVAKQYSSCNEMQRGAHQWALKVARRKGWEDLLPLGSSPGPTLYWTLERCQTVAMLCDSRSDMQRRFPGAYGAAHRNGWLDQLGLPLVDSATDNDCFYLWRAEGCTFNGLPVFKAGITSWRLGLQRIEQVAQAGGFTHTVVLRVQHHDAMAVEDFALARGVDPRLCVTDGRTEFRAYTDTDLNAIRDFALPPL